MERIAAIKVLSKMLGKQMGYRVDPKAPMADERAAAHERLPELRRAQEQAEAVMRERRQALLNEPLYQKLVAECKEAKRQVDEAYSITRHFKITVGISNSMFFHVKAQGDSWEDVIAQLKKKAPA